VTSGRLRILIVDDERPARERLRELVAESELDAEVAGEAASGPEALAILPECGADVALVDIHMPAVNGIELARHFQALERPPAVIFVTAHDQYAVQAFEVNAIDYLLKPVRLARLVAALRKIAAGTGPGREQLARADPGPRRYLSAAERGKVTLVPVDEVLFLRAEQKYVSARTREREFLIEDSLSQLEQELAHAFVRVHRNCLVARRFIRGVEQVKDTEEEAHWAVRLEGHDEPIPISRRQWQAVKSLVKT
jgi:two-component system response regulator AlgR